MTDQLRDLLTRYAEYKHVPKPPLTLRTPGDYLTQNPETNESEFLGFVAKETRLPIAERFDYHPHMELGLRATHLDWPQDPQGYVPLRLCGPGIYIGHYDPFRPLPEGLHPYNTQIVLLPSAKYNDVKKNWEATYKPQSNTNLTKPDPLTPPPNKPIEWLEWQLANGNFSEETTNRIQDAIAEGTIEKLGNDWQFWFDTKLRGGIPVPVIIRETLPCNRIHDRTLKQIEGIILFTDRQNLIQIGHVENINQYTALENLTTKLEGHDTLVQYFQISRLDYTKFEDQLAEDHIPLSTFASPEETQASEEIEIIEPSKLNDAAVEEDLGTGMNRLLQTLIFQASKSGASDLHIEPMDNCYQIRFCVNGVNIIKHATMAPTQGRSLINLIKVKSGINLSERRLPQDGKIRLLIRQVPIELRVATMPVNDPAKSDEATTIRLLSGAGQFPSLERVGMEPHHLRHFRTATKMDSGILIVTGPTGSGKTTTLYAAIQEIDKTSLNVLSIEDPIEARIPGVRQTQANHAIELNFARALRAMLRQAPNVILVGEIRDHEVASIAVQAANTGHLVLTTLHTNSAAMAIPRLLDLGIEPFQVASSLRIITAQRLLPVLCENCRLVYRPNDEDREVAKILTSVTVNEETFVENRQGCSYCRGGVSGRKMVLETIAIGKRIREAIMERAKASEIENIAKETCNFIPVAQRAMELVNTGVFSLKTAQKLITDF